MTIEELKTLRQAVIEARNTEAACRQAYESSEAYTARCAALEALKAEGLRQYAPVKDAIDARIQAEEDLRFAMGQCYLNHPTSKRLLPGLSIRVNTQWRIRDADAARAWAVRNGVHLKVDEKGLLAEAKRLKAEQGEELWENSGMAAFTAEDEVITPVIAKELV